MTVRCAVHGCKSGLVSDKQQKIRAGLKPATLFTVPKSSALLSKWSIALHQELQHNEKVCELHFAEEDVIKSDDTIMPDGSVFSLPRNKYLLRKNAIPKNIFNQENKEIEKQISIISEISQNKVLIEDINEKYMTMEQLPSSELHEMALMDVEGILINNDINHSQHDFQNESSTTEISKENGMNDELLDDHQYFIDKTKPDQYYYFNSKEAAMFAIPSVTNILNKENKKVSESKESFQAASAQNNKKNEDSSCCKVIGSEEFPPSPKAFCEIIPEVTIQSVKDFVTRNPLLKAWSWMPLTSIDNGITFTQVDCTTKKIRCFVQLHEDLTISLQTGDEEICMEIKFEIQSPKDILKLLEAVERIKLCAGTENGSRDKCCTGVVCESDSRISSQCSRCGACQRLREQFRNRLEYASHMKVKYHELKKEVHLLRRKCNNSEEKSC